jgi:hypothetical protein
MPVKADAKGNKDIKMNAGPKNKAKPEATEAKKVVKGKK